MPENCSWCNLVDCHGDGRWFCDALEDLVQIDDVRDPRCPLVEIPSEDIQPVKHGRWINTMPNVEYKSFCQVKCSICESIEAYGNFCRNCGADMRGE